MKTIIRSLAVISIFLTLIAPEGGAAKIRLDAPTAGTTELVSVTSNGTQGNDISSIASISADGRYVAFESWASNLVSGDTNGWTDIFVHDRVNRTTERISVASDELEGNNKSEDPSISGDGRYVAYFSKASNLVSGDTNGEMDVFVRDRVNGTTLRISVASDGTQGDSYSYHPSISADGRFIAFESNATNLINGDTNGERDIFLHDRVNVTTERVSVSSTETQGNAGSWDPSISADGWYVAFASGASNLVSGDTNYESDIFVRDRLNGMTERVSVANDGLKEMIFRYFQSSQPTDDMWHLSLMASSLVGGDTNGERDVYVSYRGNGTTERVSVASNGTQGNGWAWESSISANGRYVAFESNASNLVNDDTNSAEEVFIHDLVNATTERAAVANDDGAQGNNWSGNPSISSDGRYVAFHSWASNLVSVDTNGDVDVFVRDREGTELPAAWTLMYYEAGDNNLDIDLFMEYWGISQATYSAGVQATVLYDSDRTQARRIGVNSSRISGPTWQGEINTGDPATLTQFIIWSKANYPAEHYALIISDHGSVLGGAAKDVTNGDDRLTPTEIKSALNEAGKVDVLHLHTCLMGNLEIAYQLRGTADFYVAHESVMWLPSDHKRYIESITSATTPQELATNIAEAAYQEYRSPQWPSTVSLVRLSNVDAVAQKAGILGGAIHNHIFDLGIAIWAITDASVLQRFEENGDFQIDNDDRVIDLYHFAELIGGLSEPDLTMAAYELMNELNEYVLYNQHWSGTAQEGGLSGVWNHDHANGVSAVLPRNRISFYTGDWLDFADGTVWGLGPRIGAIHSVDEVFEWGPMIVDLVNTFNPDAPDEPLPPDPVAPLSSLKWIFLPTVMR